MGAGEKPQHHHNTKPEQYGVRTAEWELFNTAGRRGSSSTGRRPRGGSDMQTRNGNLIIANLVGSTRHLWTPTGDAGPRIEMEVYSRMIHRIQGMKIFIYLFFLLL
jgi:hypothetical protein